MLPLLIPLLVLLAALLPALLLALLLVLPLPLLLLLMLLPRLLPEVDGWSEGGLTHRLLVQPLTPIAVQRHMLQSTLDMVPGIQPVRGRAAPSGMTPVSRVSGGRVCC